MDKIVKIELPVVSFDTRGNKKSKSTYFDVENLRGKMIRDWENDGKKVDGLCVICGTLKLKFNSDTTSLTSENKEENYYVIDMGKEKLMEKLVKNDLAILIT